MCLSLTSLQHWSRNAIVVRFVYRALKYLVTNLGGNKTKRRNTQSHFFSFSNVMATVWTEKELNSLTVSGKSDGLLDQKGNTLLEHMA